MLFTSGKGRHYVLGYDLGDEVSQISYMAMDADMPETLSILAGAELYNIPTILCKRKDANQWFYGKEAIRHIEDEDGICVDHIVDAARKGNRIKVGDNDYDPATLLTLFVKRTLSLLSMELSLEYVDAIMFTTDSLDDRMIQVLKVVSEGLDLKKAKVFYQSHEESFYNYMMYQSEDMLAHNVIAFDYNLGPMKEYQMSFNHATTPVVVTIDTTVHNEMEIPGRKLPDDISTRQEAMSLMDIDFLKICEDACKDKIVGTVFLLGDGYHENWTKKSLDYLCRTRRVFQGNNLFSKGASIAARERVEAKPEDAKIKYVYLGEDKLKANLGMHLQKQGEMCYHALMDAGVNWFDASTTLEAILDEGNRIDIQVVPLTGDKSKTVSVILDGLEERPPRTTRILMHMSMIAATTVQVVVKDLGFGELFKSSDKIWTEEFSIVD